MTFNGSLLPKTTQQDLDHSSIPLQLHISTFPSSRTFVSTVYAKDPGLEPPQSLYNHSHPISPKNHSPPPLSPVFHSLLTLHSFPLPSSPSLHLLPFFLFSFPSSFFSLLPSSFPFPSPTFACGSIYQSLTHRQPPHPPTHNPPPSPS